MIYLLFLSVSLLFIYNTPLFGLFIKFVRKKPFIMRGIAIFGDALYMIGGGVVASVVFSIGLDGFTFVDLFTNYGTILVLVGASIREFFSEINKKG